MGAHLLGRRVSCQCPCCCLRRYPTTINAAFTYKWADGSVSTFGAALTQFVKTCPRTYGAPCTLVKTPCSWQWIAMRGDGCCGTPGAACGDISFTQVTLADAGPPPVYASLTYYVTKISLACVPVTGLGADPGTCLRSYCGNAYGWLANVEARCSCDPLNNLPDPCDPISAPLFTRSYNLLFFDPYSGDTAVDHPCDYLNYKCCPSLSLGFWDRYWHPSGGDPYPSTGAGDYIEALFTGATVCFPPPT
jgi:hypothetical protein